MDRQEEETEDGERRIESSNIGKLIPLDLFSDILLKLPAKSAARFRCVSKLWSSITTPPDFIRSFAIQSSTRLRLMVCVKTKDTRLFISLPQRAPHPDTSYSHEHPNTSYSHVVDRYEIKCPPCDYYHSPLSESVQGLVCYGYDVRNIVVWNPSMRQHVTLPEPKPRVRYLCRCLGYDPVEGKYKVLCISGRICKDPLVFTLGPQESWRLISSSPLHIPKYTKERASVCVNGHVYYEAKIRLGDTFEYEVLLMSFNVRYETFNAIQKPDDPTLCGLMLNYQGKLAWVCYIYNSLLRFWVLEDGERQEWSLREFRLPFPTCPQRDPVWDMSLLLWGVTHDTGEFIFARTTFETFFVLYYDPKRGRTRRVEYEGIGNEEFWIRNGIKLCKLYDKVYWFPNHSESLMSLENVPCLVRNVSPTDYE